MLVPAVPPAAAQIAAAPPSHLSEYAGDSEHFYNALIYIDSAKQAILHVFMTLYTDQLLEALF